MPKLTIISPSGESKTFEVESGNTVMQVGRDEMMGIEGTCGGCISCATCHVVVDPNWFRLVGEMSEDENMMLELAAERSATSRLGCQIKMSDELDGLVVRVPAES